MPHTYLVTGGAGFIGTNLVAALIDAGKRVRVLDNFSSGHESNIINSPSVSYVRGDIRSRDDVSSAMVGVDGVFHLAASVGNKRGIDNPRSDSEVNVIGTINVLEEMRAHHVSRIVYSSSAGIFGEPKAEPVCEAHACEPGSPYGASKLAGEKMVLCYGKLYGIRAVALRYFNVFGRLQRFDDYGNVIPIFATKAIAGEDLVVYGNGEQTRDFVNVHHVAKINILAMSSDDASGTFNVGTGKRTSINTLAQAFVDLVNPRLRIIHTQKRLGDVLHCTAATDRLKSSLNYSPELCLLKELADYVEWLKSDSPDGEPRR